MGCHCACVPKPLLCALLGGVALLAAGCPDVPVILIQPQSLTVVEGHVATFSCVAFGAWPLSYQWKKDGVELTVAQLASYTTPPVNGLYEGKYTCEVSNANGSTESSAATLTVVAPTYTEAYQEGYLDGFAEDDYYWDGFDDSLDTITRYTAYYDTSDIPDTGASDYETGYNDGIWTAYNDGYFVCYDYAFTIGFSEGYDAAFFSGYLNFLASDAHTEYANGGWADGYNDGFSEGRVFGAYDYETGASFDWFDAMEEYRSGIDRYFSDIDVGTGDYGPVTLYAYGTDPNESKARSIPATVCKDYTVTYRTLTSSETVYFNKKPSTTARSDRDLTLATTWLQRINKYMNSVSGSR